MTYTGASPAKHVKHWLRQAVKHHPGGITLSGGANTEFFVDATAALCNWYRLRCAGDAIWDMLNEADPELTFVDTVRRARHVRTPACDRDRA